MVALYYIIPFAGRADAVLVVNCALIMVGDGYGYGHSYGLG